ncbi:hypothetical protein B0T26DRAFT_742882 [Lasiosphaeria miniovina]|uniref:Chromo domain-containing protein n=1 Tax=Lasiosphaeria miniovina TaxID=1954250 RepID=A0AA40A5B2_9PEZI|nr:uncharacterized protein B0T26DRAFT_742882 [Lasiosphaeria miniovina]KAK0709441.1 hypothetical protein B0T26DRAFT_742882 [Lasiosphaeria miniovina]
MPPGLAVSDNEDDSEQELAAPVKKTVREKKPVAYTDEQDDEVDEPLLTTSDKNGDAGDSDGDDEELEEEEYVVEKIMSHMIDAQGKLLFEVKWEGYEKKSDRTWEPEENFAESASLALEEYFRSAGGRGKVFKSTANPLKGKKRGRQSTGTPAATGKRSKKNGEQHPADEDTPLTAKNVQWKPPAGSWEDHIAQLDACEDEDTHKLMVYLTWKNGHKTQHETSVIYNRCPQKMLQFYERHVRIIKRDDQT